MQNRIRSNPAATVIPMPGRLSVTRPDADYLAEVYATLNEVSTGDTVHAVGTIATVRYLDRDLVRRSIRTGDRTNLGRVMLVITDHAGNSAHVTIPASLEPGLRHALYQGATVAVQGVAFRTVPNQPAGIAARTLRVVNV